MAGMTIFGENPVVQDVAQDGTSSPVETPVAQLTNSEKPPSLTTATKTVINLEMSAFVRW